MQKLIIEIKKEEEENTKLKKGKENKEFQKIIDKVKKISRTNAIYLDTEKIYSILKNMNDLIQTYIKDSE